MEFVIILRHLLNKIFILEDIRKGQSEERNSEYI